MKVILSLITLLVFISSVAFAKAYKTTSAQKALNQHSAHSEKKPRSINPVSNRFYQKSYKEIDKPKLNKEGFFKNSLKKPGRAGYVGNKKNKSLKEAK